MSIALQHAAPHTLLEVYLDDHLAAGTAGIDLARRCLSSNPNGELGEWLRRFIPELEEDRELITRVIATLDMRASTVKVLAARGAERVGRLKLNGQLTGYSPLSRLVELEGLAVGVDARGSALRVLQALAETTPALQDVDWQRSVDRARRQREDLERFRMQAALTAFKD